MNSRAGLSRTVTLVVALSLTAASTGAVARAFDGADAGGAIDLDRSNVATIGSEIPVRLEPRRLDGPAMAGIQAQAQHFPAAVRPIERIRKVE